jgi:two-component system cell cycle response regulator DivK
MKVLNDVLIVHGYRILKTGDGLEALALAGENLPDLILMDIRLHGISGIEATKWLKQDEATNDIPVIAVTAYAMPGDEAAIRKSGCDDYLSKPVSIPNLLATIRRHLPPCVESQ